MEPHIYAPFLVAARDLFHRMMSTTLTFGRPVPNVELHTGEGLTGVIRLTGDLSGIVMLCFDTEVAERCAGVITGIETPDDELTADAVGELTNIVAGAAKSSFEDRSIAIGCPEIMHGTGTAAAPAGGVCLSVPCESGLGAFNIKLCLLDELKAAA